MISAIECRAQNATIRAAADGLPTGEPDTDFSPIISENAPTSKMPD